MTGNVNIHPAVDHGVTQGAADFAGGVLSCACTDRTVKVRIEGNVAYNHVCGCTKCWKPAGANFSMVAVAPMGKVSVLENGDKLKVVDPSALIQRHACVACGVHMHGPVEREHPFQGLSFVHPERFDHAGYAAPEFAAFVSSIIEAGAPKSQMGAVRARLKDLGLEPYDCLAPGLMDYIAEWTAKKAGTFVE